MRIIHTCKSKRFVLALIAVVLFGYGTRSVFAETSPSVLYVPLIGVTSVPEPLVLPKTGGNVSYHYAVKNFLFGVALVDVHVVDNVCDPVAFVNGDDNLDSKLDYSETWRYVCTTKLSTTTESTATATGFANNLTATHKAYVTVVVGSNDPAPLISIINVTKVAYPLSLPADGGKVTFTYKVNNPGVVPLSDVIVTDDKCNAMSGKLGDINGNNLLDINEVWIYRCKAVLRQTTTNTVYVTASANGFRAIGDATITVQVDALAPSFPDALAPSFPETGAYTEFKVIVWGIFSSVLAALIIIFFFVRKNKPRKMQKSPGYLRGDEKQ